MALIKETSNSGSHTLVTFKIEKEKTPNKTNILLLGDFNNWEVDTKNHMEINNDAFLKSIKLENGQRYEFRYMNQDYVWFNDEAADDYVPSPFEGITNCVVDLSHLPKTTKSTKATKTSKKDDLKKIEGIGPKIASILVDNGIDTFEKLSETPITFLAEVLKNAGPRFSMHKPTTWPKQAKLAHLSKWDELKELQDILDGGK